SKCLRALAGGTAKAASLVGIRSISSKYRGTKTSTVRLGELDVSGRHVWLSDRRSRVRGEIIRVENKRRYGGLTWAGARADGQPSLQAMSADLTRFCGELEPSQPVTVIWFRLTDERPQ